MIRIYFDWNVISNLKKPEYQDIRNFIDSNKKHLLFPYSPAHFTDIMKSYKPGNTYFQEDIETLEYLSEKHLIRWGEDRIEPLFATPKEYFETQISQQDHLESLNIERILETFDSSSDDQLGLNKISSLIKAVFKLQPSNIEVTDENKKMLNKMFPNLKSDSTMWDLMKDFGPFSEKLLLDGDYYKDFRKTISEHGFKLESNSGNWSYNKVIENIDDFLLNLGTKMTYREYIETNFKHKKEPIDSFEYFLTAYLMLDMIGYKTDKLPKPTDNMQNITADGEHSFYAAFCDFFVASDKKLMTKSKVLYNEFNVDTKIIEPREFITEVEKIMDATNKDSNCFENAFSFCKKEYLVRSFPAIKDNRAGTLVFTLPRLYFNCFNYIIYSHYPDKGLFILTFKKVFNDFSKFIYYTETERLVDKVTDFFGYENKDELKSRKKEFVLGNTEITFEWNFAGRRVILKIDEETARPILEYLIF